MKEIWWRLKDEDSSKGFNLINNSEELFFDENKDSIIKLGDDKIGAVKDGKMTIYDYDKNVLFESDKFFTASACDGMIVLIGKNDSNVLKSDGTFLFPKNKFNIKSYNGLCWVFSEIDSQGNVSFNCADKDGVTLFDKNFDKVLLIGKDFVEVERNDTKKIYIIQQKRFLEDKFKLVFGSMLKKGDKWNYLKSDGTYLSDLWFDMPIGSFRDDYLNTELKYDTSSFVPECSSKQFFSSLSKKNWKKIWWFKIKSAPLQTLNK